MTKLADPESPVAFCLMREIKQGMAYEWFHESLDEVVNRGSAVDYLKYETKIWPLAELELDKFLARTLDLREYKKLSVKAKCVKANEVLLHLAIFPDFEPGEWETVDSPSFFGFKLKGKQLDTSRTMWADR